MGLNVWWAQQPEQRFWMEITNRGDLGADLHAPALDDSGRETPGYSLVREVRDGDVVFHYEKAREAITSWSIAHGGYWEAETLWGTPRSTGPTGHPVEPYPRPGLWHGLHGPFALPQPLTREEIRNADALIRDVRASVSAANPGRLYYPFQLRGDGVRAAQTYLSKMPAELVAALDVLAAVAGVRNVPELPAAGVLPGGLGVEYVPADEQAAQPDRDPFPVDPAVVERGMRSHAKLQNAVAAHAASQGFAVRTPKANNPPWDVLWVDGPTVWFAEVKSLTAKNEERQLRLGLGQLLRYRHRLRTAAIDARAVLMAEHQPTDPEWQALCDELGITLVWPDVLQARL